MNPEPRTIRVNLDTFFANHNRTIQEKEIIDLLNNLDATHHFPENTKFILFSKRTQNNFLLEWSRDTLTLNSAFSHNITWPGHENYDAFSKEPYLLISQYEPASSPAINTNNWFASLANRIFNLFSSPPSPTITLAHITATEQAPHALASPASQKIADTKTYDTVLIQLDTFIEEGPINEEKITAILEDLKSKGRITDQTTVILRSESNKTINISSAYATERHLIKKGDKDYTNKWKDVFYSEQIIKKNNPQSHVNALQH